MAYSSPPTTPVRRPTKGRDQVRPASPSPSASGFSLIGPEEAIDYNEFWTYNTSSRRAAVYSTPTLNYFSSSSSSSSPVSWSLNSSPTAGLRGLFPRLWDVLVSSPTKNILSPSPRQPQSQRQYSVYGTYPRSKRRCSSENILPIPFPVQTTSSSPESYAPSSPVSRSPIQPLHRPSFSSISSQSSSSSYTHINYSDLPPLDGEEGELVDVDDEACFLPSRHSKLHNGNYLGGNYIWTCRYNCRLTCNHPMSWRPRQSFSRARVITGIDIIGLLPAEIALEVFLYIATSEISWASADEIRRTSADALEDILMCMNVNKTWRALAADNSVWKILFEGRWVGGITTSESRLSRYRERQKTRRSLDPREKSLPPIPGSVEEAEEDLLPNLNYLDLYRERFELDKRWAGTAFTKRIITPSFFSSPSPITTPTSSSNTITPISTSTSSSTATSAYNSVTSSPTTTTHLPLPSPDEDLSPIQYYAQSSGRPFSLAAHYAPANGLETNGTLIEEQWDKFEPGIVRLEGHSDSVYCVEFVTASPLRLSPKWWDPLADDDEHIITGSRDKTIKMWSLRTGRCVGTFGNSSTSVSPSQRLAEELEVEGHSGSVLCLKFFWLDNEPEEELDKGKGKAGERTFHSRRGVVYSGSSDRMVLVWDIWTEAAEGDAGYGYVVKARVSTVLRGHHGGVLDLRVDDKYIVSCCKDAAIRVWHRSSLSRAASASSTDLGLTMTQQGPHANLTLRGHEGPVNAVGLEGGRVVSASGDGKMILWDVVSGEKIRTFEGHDRGLACIEFKDNLIISGSNDCKIKIWDQNTGECLRTLEGHESLVRTLAFDSQRGILVSASYDKSVRVWDVRDVCAGNGRKMKDGVPKSKQLREFRNAHTSHIFDVRFDARRIVSTSHDQKIVVADFARGLDGAELFV